MRQSILLRSVYFAHFTSSKILQGQNLTYVVPEREGKERIFLLGSLLFFAAKILAHEEEHSCISGFQNQLLWKPDPACDGLKISLYMQLET